VAHYQKDLKAHFDLQHLAIDDLAAPSLAQVDILAALIRNHEETSDPLVVHCMAGIGRTSTMIVAAHLRLGYKLEALKEQLALQNPAFKWTDNQTDFIHKMI
jgi:protein-tyrosine phosphatase